MDIKAVEFQAEIRQLKTMADGTVNLILNLPESALKQAGWLLQNVGAELHIVAEVVDND